MLVVAVAAVRLSVRSGLPSLLIYLGIGLALGEGAIGIDFDSTQLTLVLGYAALVLILVEGGITTRWSGIRKSVAPAATLATVGVAVSVVTVAAVAHLALGWSWEVSLLVGAVVSSTDAAAVFSVLRRVPLPRRVSGMLEAEAGFNDAPVVLLVTALAASLAPGATPEPWWSAPARRRGGARRWRRHRAGHRLGRRRGSCAGSRRRHRPCSRSAWCPSPSSRTPPRTPCTPRGSSRATSRPWCWATSRCHTDRPSAASRPRSAGWPRSGSSCCSDSSPHRPASSTSSCRRSSWVPPCCCWGARCR